jgi:hypothetical protein
MKYGITILLLISCTTHAGPLFSRPPMPLQYIYVTPTLIDNDSHHVRYMGKYSYVDYSDGTLPPAQRPSQPRDSYSVNIESAKLSMNPDPHKEHSLKTILAITYSIQKRTEAGIETIQEAETVRFDYLAADGKIVEKALPELSCTLRILASRTVVSKG